MCIGTRISCSTVAAASTWQSTPGGQSSMRIQDLLQGVQRYVRFLVMWWTNLIPFSVEAAT